MKFIYTNRSTSCREMFGRWFITQSIFFCCTVSYQCRTLCV